MSRLIPPILLLAICCLSPGAAALTGFGDSTPGPLDTAPPVFTLVNAIPSEAFAGTTVLLHIAASEALEGLPDVLVNGRPAYVSGAAKSFAYTAEYLVQEMDTPGMAFITVLGQDLAGNSGQLTDDTALKIVDIPAGLPVHAWGIGLFLGSLGVLLLAMRRHATLVLAVTLLLASPMARASGPQVVNVTFTQRPGDVKGTVVDIYFSLHSPLGPCSITVWLSKDGGNDGFPHPATSLTGALLDVESGDNHHILWDVAADYPGEDLPLACIRVVADDGVNEYTATYLAGHGGAINGESTQLILHGRDGKPVWAVPDEGYHFTQWNDGRTDNPRTDTGVTGDIAVEALFAINTYTLTYTAGANGAVTGNAIQTVNHGADGTEVWAVPDDGYHFTQWSDGSIANPRTDMLVIRDIAAEAEFEVNRYTLVYTVRANGTLNGETLQTVPHGGSGTAVTAVPHAGYHFFKWGDLREDNPRTDTHVTSDIAVAAAFMLNTYSLTYTAGANGVVTGNAIQTINHGANGTEVWAVPDEGYHFIEWSDGNTDNPRTDTGVTSDITVEALFAINIYTLTYTAGPYGSISGNTVQLVAHGGDGMAVEAVPSGGYRFFQWSDERTGESRVDLNVQSDITVTALFETRPVGIWNNALFGGSGQGGLVVNGNVAIYGSLHLLGDSLLEGDTAIEVVEFGLEYGALQHNYYWGMPTGLLARIPPLETVLYNGEVVQTLNAVLRVKKGLVGLNGNAQIGTPFVPGSGVKGPIDATYNTNGWTGNQVADDGGRGIPNSFRFVSDNGHEQLYDLGDRVTFPALSDDWRESDGTRILNPNTGTWYTHKDYFTQVLVGAPDDPTDGILFGNIDLEPRNDVAYGVYWNASTGEYLTGEAALNATPDPEDDFLQFNPVEQTLMMNGSMRINGNVTCRPRGARNTIHYSGRAVFLVDGDVSISTSLLACNHGDPTDTVASYPEANLLCMMASRNIMLGETAIGDIMGVFYTAGTMIIKRQCIIIGAVAANCFNMGGNYPFIYHVPAVAHHLPRGMIGRYEP